MSHADTGPIDGENAVFLAHRHEPICVPTCPSPSQLSRYLRACISNSLISHDVDASSTNQ
jgi:hypothetical protein